MAPCQSKPPLVFQMFPTDDGTRLFGDPRWARALETWRQAEGLVAIRWQAFLEAGPQSRSSAFTSYVAALDAEEAAATEITALSSRIAA
jgi:hypothetical protein